MFFLTLKCQSRELRGRVTVREENCDKTARCTFKCWIVARNEQKSWALPRKRERGDYHQRYNYTSTNRAMLIQHYLNRF